LSAEERQTGLAPIEQWSGGRPRPPTPLATNEPDAYRPPWGCARGRTALCLRRLPTPTAAVRLESKWEIRRAEASLFNSQLCDAWLPDSCCWSCLRGRSRRLQRQHRCPPSTNTVCGRRWLCRRKVRLPATTTWQPRLTNHLHLALSAKIISIQIRAVPDTNAAGLLPVRCGRR